MLFSCLRFGEVFNYTFSLFVLLVLLVSFSFSQGIPTSTVVLWRLTSSVYGFPDYESLLTLNDNGTVRFYAGMVSKELGAWSVIEGDPDEGEDPSDLYLAS